MNKALFPCAGAHSVQNAAFAVEWQGELKTEDLTRITGARDQLRRHSLTQHQEIKSVTFQMGPLGHPAHATEAPSGISFFSPGVNGASRMLLVERSRCVAQINDYTRWQPVWAAVRQWFECVVPLIEEGRQFTAVGLQYNDVFFWRGKIEAFDPQVVFRRESRYLPSNALANRTAWHSHHGYFEKSDRDVTILENVGVRIIDDLGQRSIVISTVHKANLVAWGWEELKGYLDPVMEDLHQRNKRVLSSVLSDDAAEMVSLKGGDHVA